MRRVALFGASFDPPTGDTGHGGIISFLSLVFPEVWLLPVFQHPFPSKRKRVEHTSYDHRLQMLALQFGSMPNVKIVEAERDLFKVREQAGLKGEDLVFGTFDLIEYLRRMNPTCVFHFVLGGDTLLDLVNGKWRRSEEMMQSTPIVAIKRAGVVWDEHAMDLSKLKAGVAVYGIPHLDSVSSSLVRNRLQLGQDVDRMVDARVLEFIKTNHLYEQAPRRTDAGSI